MSLLWIPVCLAAVTVSSCGSFDHFEAGPSKEETVTLERDKAEMVSVELKLAAGELKVSGGSSKLLEAKFRFNSPASKPRVRYDASAFRGKLTIDQDSDKPLHGNASWNLKFSNDVPLDLSVHSGATEATLDVGSLDLRKLDCHVGVGKVEIDLRGKPRRGFDVSVKGGVGEANIYLPSGVNLMANAQGGIGEISVEGLTREGNRWVRRVPQIGAPTIHVDVHGGIGSIKLVAE